MKSVITLFVTFFLLVSCGGSGSSKSSSSGASGSTNSSHEIDIIGKNFSTPKAVFKKIAQMAEFSEIKPSWLTGSWASSSAPGLGAQDRYYKFNLDGTFDAKSITLRTKKTTAFDGVYKIYKHNNSPWSVVLLVPNSNKVITSFILEPVNKQSFRLINKYKYPAFGSSFLYTKLDSQSPMVYPGGYFLGTYQYVDHTNILDGSYKNVYHYVFSADKTVFKKHFYDSDLQSITEGSWRINEQSYQLEMDFSGPLEKYSLTTEFDPDGPMISLKKEGVEDSLHWKKINDVQITTTLDRFVGEYRDHDGVSYLTIKKDTNTGGYLVDISYAFYQGSNIVPIINDDGYLEMTIDDGYYDRKLILKPGYNRIIKVKDGIISQMEYLEKISRHILPKQTKTIVGGWNTRNYSTGKYVDFQYYLNDGSFFRTGIGGEVIYGAYTYENNTLTTKRDCRDTSTRNEVKLEGIYLDNILTYYPVAGFSSFGEAGSDLESLLFKHQLHVYQTKQNVKLKPHPEIKGAYLFTKKREFNDVYNYFKLNSDGTGTFFAGSSLYYEDDFGGTWNQEINSHFYNIKYLVVLDNNKERLLYYHHGASVHYSGHRSETLFLDLKETIEDARSVELFHGRTALCYRIPNDKLEGSGIVLPEDREPKKKSKQRYFFDNNLQFKQLLDHVIAENYTS